MSRFIVAGKKLSANHIVRITGDNPLTDPRLIDYMIRIHLKNKNEYTFSSSAPIGISSEVINYNTLTKCHSNLSDPSSSEYMSWMLNRPDIFKVQDVVCPKRLAKSNSISFTVDEEHEYLNIKKIFSYYKGNPFIKREINKDLFLGEQTPFKTMIYLSPYARFKNNNVPIITIS